MIKQSYRVVDKHFRMEGALTVIQSAVFDNTFNSLLTLLYV